MVTLQGSIVPKTFNTSNSQQTRKSGFTIVELLIVIVIIGVLATIAVIAYSGIKKKANIAVISSDLNNAAKTLKLDQVLTGLYPGSTGAANSGKGLFSSNGTTYQYTVSGTNPQTFCLTATNGADAYNITDDGAPTEGVCAGHTAPSTGGTTLLANAGVVTTLAGSGTAAFADGTGSGASFNWPEGIAVNASGTLFVADTQNSRIRQISSSGVVTTLAGGTRGFSDGNGTSASFNWPTGLAVDSAGNVFVADTMNNRIRKITPAGDVTTIAGSGTATFAEGTGSGASFNSPHSLALDSTGTIYVADSTNNRIRKVTSAGVVTTLAGNSTPSFGDGTGTAAFFKAPRGITMDSADVLYVSDYSNFKIRKVTTAGVVTTVAGAYLAGTTDGAVASAQFNNPSGITIDSAGTIYVADSSNNRIRKITAATTVSILAGTSFGYIDATGTSARFNIPSGIAVDATGTIYIADTANNRIRKIR